MSKQFNVSALKPLINNEFTFQSDSGESAFTAKLAEVECSAMNGDQWEAFNATFIVSEGQDVNLSESQYTIKHDALGETTLFGSPNSEKELEFCCSYAIEN